MPKIKRTSPIQIRLQHDDLLRLDQLCQQQGKHRTEFAREAINWYLNNQDNLITGSKESEVERRLAKMEDRLAKLQVKVGIDVGMIYLLIYRNMNLEERDKAVQWAYNGSIKRLRKKLEEKETCLVEQVKTNDTLGH